MGSMENNCFQCKTTMYQLYFKQTLTHNGVMYINDLPKVVNNNSKPVLFADDTSIIVRNPNLLDFKNDLISSFDQ
jgi:hypothetical protein